MTLGSGAQERLAIVLAGMLGESDAIATDIAAYFSEYLRRAPLLAAVGLRLMVWALLWLPIVFVGRPLPASSLPLPVRDVYLARWADSHVYYIREGFFLVKTVALLGWGAHPAVRARYDMPPAAVSFEAKTLEDKSLEGNTRADKRLSHSDLREKASEAS